MSSFNSDRLVLFIEEEYSEDDVINDNKFGFSFFVLYDENEREYFITGKSSDNRSNDFKFYCKRTKNIYKYIKSLILDESMINMALYNFSNLYENNDCIDFTALQEMTDTNSNELQGYFGVTEKGDVINLLKLLKRVRY